jgi:hypothetical protein
VLPSTASGIHVASSLHMQGGRIADLATAQRLATSRDDLFLTVGQLNGLRGGDAPGQPQPAPVPVRERHVLAAEPGIDVPRRLVHARRWTAARSSPAPTVTT